MIFNCLLQMINMRSLLGKIVMFLINTSRPVISLSLSLFLNYLLNYITITIIKKNIKEGKNVAYLVFEILFFLLFFLRSVYLLESNFFWRMNFKKVNSEKVNYFLIFGSVIENKLENTF
jgi:hypothetical protein